MLICKSISACLSVCLSVCVSVCLCVCLSVYLCLSVCLSVYVSVCLCVCLSVSPSPFLFLGLSLSPSVIFFLRRSESGCGAWFFSRRPGLTPTSKLPFLGNSYVCVFLCIGADGQVFVCGCVGGGAAFAGRRWTSSSPSVHSETDVVSDPSPSPRRPTR